MIQSLILAVSYGFGLAMDAFAVAICKGLSMKRINYRHSLIIALFFGVFQAIMPLAGYFLGSTFKDYITTVDHWIAFALLCYIGGKMVWESIRSDNIEEACCECMALDIKELFMLALATSIDALAIGITFSFDKSINIYFDSSVIGITTFIIAFGGVIIGNKFGSHYKKKAEICGGIILIILGIRILAEALVR